MKLRRFRVWFTTHDSWSEEDYLEFEAMNEEQAWHKAMKANKHLNGFEVQSVESLD